MDCYEALKKAAVQILSLIDPKKPKGTEFFNALARITVSVAVEAVCLRRNPSTSALEVLMIKRLPNETYPNEWHCPGSIMRPGEEIEDVFTRLAEKEFKAEITSREFVNNLNNSKEIRGHCFSLVYFCTVREDARGTWHPVDRLPANTVDHHRDSIIPMVVEKMKRRV